MKYISAGKILNFHGIKGEAKVGFSKGRDDFFSSLKEVFVEIEANKFINLKINSIRISKNNAIVKFDGIDDINEILKYKNKILFVEESTIRENLKEDEYLIDELVGLIAYDTNNKKLGFVVGVSNNGANDLLSIKTVSKHICLVPLVKQLVPEINFKEKRVTINNIEGLLE